MGCFTSRAISPEDVISQHISKLAKMAKDEKLKKKEDLIEKKIREELHMILQIAKQLHSLKASIFHDLICALDDLGIIYPGVITKLTTLSNATKRIIRIRCIGITSDENKVDDHLEASLHVIQKSISQVSIHSSSPTIDRGASLKSKENFSRSLSDGLDDDSNKLTSKQHQNDYKLRKLMFTRNDNDLSTHNYDANDYGFYDVSSHSNSNSQKAKY
jgi:hypothetical protein